MMSDLNFLKSVSLHCTQNNHKTYLLTMEPFLRLFLLAVSDVVVLLFFFWFLFLLVLTRLHLSLLRNRNSNIMVVPFCVFHVQDVVGVSPRCHHR